MDNSIRLYLISNYYITRLHMKLIMSIQLILLTAVLVTTVFSVGITTILINSSYAQEQKFITSLTGDQEVPPSGSAAKGSAWFKPNNDSMWYIIDVTGLDTVMEAHMHIGKSGQNGDPVVMLFHSGPTGPLNGTLIQGSFSAAELYGPMSGKTISYLLDKMNKGGAYVNIHTGSFPNGEIRGQISRVNSTINDNTTMTAHTTPP
ncbi:MAG: CHRD domain-containing protein [Nitrososphaeraceae archaeon]